MSRSRPFALLLVLFFCSGVCGLTYQVLWLRLLSLVFGVTVYAASTVLAAFMTGLACGSLLAAPLLKRCDRPLVVFGAAEVLIGVSALLTPLGLDVAEGLYRVLYGSGLQGFGTLTFARLLCSFTVLLIPTVLMGVTLPVLSGWSVVRAQLGSRIGALYAVNTAGAVVGAVLTGFILIGRIGIQNTFFLAAAMNILIGAVAIGVGFGKGVGRVFLPERAVPEGISNGIPEQKPGYAVFENRPDPIFTAVIALSGVAALALEIVWFRLLVQFLDATTYAFTTMLATVLAGIAAGGAIAARQLRVERDRVASLALLQCTTALAVLASAAFLAWSYNAGWKTAAPVQASVAAIFPAALLMGVTFPITLRLGAGAGAGVNAQHAARSIGVLYAANVGGAIAGALLGGFVLIPQLGTRGALIATAAVYIATAALLVARLGQRYRVIAACSAAAIVFAILASRVPDPFNAAFARRYGRDMREFWRDDGVQTAVSVHASQFRRSLYLDGLHQANDTPDMVKLHRVIGHLPMVLHTSPADALVVGLGGGATAGAVSQYPGIRVQIVELSDGVRRAADFFSHISYDVLDQPHVRLRVDDGRNFLLLSGERFDVITADIIQPSHAGAGNLYSREYFSLVRQALKEGGLAMQWIGHRPETQYKLIMRTFLSVFPNTTLWYDGSLMIGSVEPIRIHASAFAAKRSNAQTAAALDDIDLRDFDTLTHWYTAGPDEMRRFVGDGPLLTDDQPLVEYNRALPANDPAVDLSAIRGDISRVISQ